MYHSSTPPPLPPKPESKSPNTALLRRSFRNSVTSKAASVENWLPPILKQAQVISPSHPAPYTDPVLLQSKCLPKQDTVSETSPSTNYSYETFEKSQDAEGHSKRARLPSPSHLTDLDLLPQTTTVSTAKNVIYDDIMVIKREKLSDIVTDSSVLPMKVAFCDSVYGLCESFTFAENELFDVHFLKESIFANVHTTMGETVKIPLQAPFHYTLDYPPSSICDAEYKVPQLMKLKKLPSIAIVRDGGGSKSVLQKVRKKSSEFVTGEVLIFKGQNKSSVIECFSLSHKETKKIHKSSELTLTTNPSQSTFKLTELVFFDLPLRVQLYPSQVKLQPKFRSTSTIISLTKEKSLITSFSDVKKSSLKIYEIFVDVAIDFQRVHILPNEQNELIKKSKSIFENFSPTNVEQVVPNTSNHCSQKELYELLIVPSDYGDEQQWKNVTKLLRPKAFNQILSSPTSSSEGLQKEEGQVSMPTPELSTQQQIEERSPHSTTNGGTSLDYDYVRSEVRAAIRPNSIAIEPYVPMVSPDLKKRSSLDSGGQSLLLASSPLTALTTPTNVLPPLPPLPPPIPPHDINIVQDHFQFDPKQDFTETDGNKIHLEDLSCDQVILLLDKLGLSKYKNLFIEEKISGGILQELDEEMLEQDLGITSRLHRLKLKRVIEGKEPLDALLK